MPVIRRNKIEPYSADQMYQLVNDVASYPKFLPWCRNSRVEIKTERMMQASILMAKGPLNKWFTTKNQLIPGERIEMALVKGPFKHLRGIWEFKDRPEGGSEIFCNIDFDFAFGPAKLVLTPIFESIASSMIVAFSERAKVIYG